MRYEMRTTAYDCMDLVNVSTAVYLTRDTVGEPPQLVAHWTSTIQGEGQTEPCLWARDALLAAIEDL